MGWPLHHGSRDRAQSRLVGRRVQSVLALAGVLFLVALPLWIAWQIHTSENPVGSVSVYSGYLAPVYFVVPLLVGLITWWWKARVASDSAVSTATQAAASKRLAENMLTIWRQEAKDRRISTPAPVRVRWQWGPPQVASPVTELINASVGDIVPGPLRITSGSGTPGVPLDGEVVTQLHDEVYSRFPRLVLIGTPGAGKTGAMILLLLAALKHRRILPETQADDIPVPVWLTLGGWDPTTQTLHHWAKTIIYRDHPYLRTSNYGRDVADELLRNGRVALFLDGLDEMTPNARAKALERIDREAVNLRIVLSSRPDEYAHALSTERLYNTAVIEVQPVTPAAAHAYLVHEQIGLQRDLWQQVGSYLEANPTSVATRGLNNPLTLSLARDTYQKQDPTTLIDPTRFPTVTALREHLIDRILVTAYPDERQRNHATQWLAWIAHHMGSNRDLGWWEIPTWITRRQRYLAVAVVAGCLGIFGFALGLLTPQGRGSINILLRSLGSGAALGFLSTLMFGLFVRHLPRGAQDVMRFRWPRPREIARILMSTVAMGLGTAFMTGFVVGRQHGLRVGIFFGAFFGIALLPAGLMISLKKIWEVPFGTVAATPSTEYRHNRRSGLIFALITGVVVGPYMGFLLSFAYNDSFAAGLVVGITLGVMIGAEIGLRNPAPLLVLAQFVFAITRHGRVSFVRLLEDAHHDQILRQAGAVYQFRHAELQKHLSKLYCAQA